MNPPSDLRHPSLYIEYNQGQHLALKHQGMTVAEELYVDTLRQDTHLGQRLQMHIHPKQPITLEKVVWKIPIKEATTAFFANGFQSWSESREYVWGESIPRLRKWAWPWLKHYGDYGLGIVPEDQLHSWTYTYLRQQGGGIQLFASLSESTGYTLFYSDGKTMTVERDCSGLELSHSFPALDFVHLQGEMVDTFQQWWTLSGIQPPKVRPAVGWTSWYHYYTNINEAIILENLQAFQQQSLPLDIFQIDDGYQTKVGDWLEVDVRKFPRGMAHLAQEIHKAGAKAGLWLAPFVVEKKSSVFKEKKHWLLKNEKGKPVSVGYNPLWSGHFYALDVYHSEVREYLRGVFHTILHRWGFDMVKLDFLYAVAVLSRKGKTRGQVMSDAMDFLRQICAGKTILGCGVPLGSAFGKVDYCRIGADIHLSWEHSLLRFLRNRERVSTIVALRSVLGRWALDGQAFLNDPDVFILRQGGHRLSSIQQHTVLTLNSILGSLLFCSDAVGDYSPEQLEQYRSIYKWLGSEVREVIQHGRDGYEVVFRQEGRAYRAFANLDARPRQFPKSSDGILLAAYETRVLEEEQV